MAAVGGQKRDIVNFFDWSIFANNWQVLNSFNYTKCEYRDYFGESVAISGNNVGVGAPAEFKDPAIGSAYIYDLTCPSSDLTGDCYVDFKDFATMAGQWLDGIKPLDVIP